MNRRGGVMNREQLEEELYFIKILRGQIRPRQRCQCINHNGPCPFVSCKHHLYLDVDSDTGEIIFNFPGKEVWELQETCALDAADKKGLSDAEVAALMGLNVARFSVLKERTLRKVKRILIKEGKE